MTHPTEWIATTAELESLVEHLRSREWFALDTEFIRETTYWPKLCLVQVATTERVACIDPFSCHSLDPLHAALDDPAVTKVLHAAGQDLEIFHHLTGRMPQPLFDTQVAAPLVGFPEQAGFARLVEAVLDVKLGKGHSRTDWNERPLPEEVIEYAADDVRYLVPLYQALREQLAARGRLGWLDADFEALADPARFERPNADAWQRLKGIDRLSNPSRAVAAALAEWRERTAREADRPRGHVLRDDALLDIAKALPKDRKSLARLRSLRGNTVDRHGDKLLALVAEARKQTPPESGPEREKLQLDENSEALTDALSALLRLRAAREGLNPASIATRRDLARIATGTPAGEILEGWRAELVARDLDDFFAGHTRLAVDPTTGTLDSVD
ncbi:MAG: ribonuclease D [Halofilum sp. (in: g-proteobacteria)]|nr:ribonuclease D [Halofilum sp. (in: g-proteobacteria)]